MNTVACVLKTGGTYDLEWVCNLSGGVRRHLPVPHRFVCLTDDPVALKLKDAYVEFVPLLHGWKGWWSKIELFRPGLFAPGNAIYFDLDMVITNDLTRIAWHKHRFTMCHEFYRPQHYCSTAMAWNASEALAIYSEFKQRPDEIMRKYDSRRPDRLIGDQAFIEHHLLSIGLTPDTFKNLWGDDSIASYKVHKCDKRVPANAMAVAFHGRPKPHEITGGWVPLKWKGAAHA